MSGYIGTQPVPQATQTRQTFVATAAQTSFATGGYQAGYLDVFLNGVKLQDGVDYTATNGSDIVLTVGAALDDTLEVVAYTAFEVLDQTFTGTTTTDVLTTTGAFTSLGIDDNATSTAMTLNSSGKVGIGTTNPVQLLHLSKSGITGMRIQDTDAIGGFTDLEVNGAAFFIKSYDDDGTEGQVVFKTANTETMRIDSSGNVGIGTTSPSAALDVVGDIEVSGGIYLGGTGAANKLDDYEEGTFTPTITGGLTSGGSAAGQYTKVGGLVQITLRIYRPADISSSTDISIGGLPFAASSIGSEQVLNLAVRYANMSNYQIAGFSVTSGASSGAIRIFAENSGDFDALQHAAFTSSYSTVVVSGTYQTNA